MANESFDLVILGSGPGGYVAAIRASQLGLKTAIVERERLGGICLNWGCIPTKALLRTSEIYHYMQHADAYGLSASNVAFDLAKVVDRSRKVAGQLNAGVKGLMKKHKVTVVEGSGVLTGAGELTVTTGDQTRVLTAPNIIIATGARARDLPGLAADGERVWTYRHAMVPPAMPTKLLVIGSGAIGVEFASFYSDMGAKVTIVEMLDRILPVEDAEVSAFMAKTLTKQGMTIVTGAKVSDVKPGPDGVSGDDHRGRRQGGGRQLQPCYRRHWHRPQYREHRPRGARREDRPRPHRHRRLWPDQRRRAVGDRRRHRCAVAGAQGEPRRASSRSKPSPGWPASTRCRPPTSPAAPIRARRSPASA